MVYPDIFIKTLIKQKLICGIVFEFKGEKDGQTAKPLQSRSALPIKDARQPQPANASPAPGCLNGFARSRQNARE